MRLTRIIILRHILVWILFIAYEVSLIKISVGLTSPLFHLVVYYVLNIVLFYFKAHVILDYAFFKTGRPNLIATLFILLEIIVHLFIKLEVDSIFTGVKYFSFLFTSPMQKVLLSNIWREIFFIGFSIAYWSMLYMMRFKERNHVMEKEQLRSIAHTLELENKYITAENAYLQNQISPHLLFNSLNFIYGAIHKLSERAGKGVMLLSEIMRYSLVSSEDNRTVLLTDEVAQIESLIELSHLRFEHQLYIRFKKKGKLKEVRLLPLILITLVENMVKHGDLGVPEQPGRISLTYAENLLEFKTQNLKRTSSPHPLGGIGLKNIEKRLSNFYPDRYQLQIQETETVFTVTLNINLNP